MSPCKRAVKVIHTDDHYSVFCCGEGHVHIAVDKPEFKGTLILGDSNQTYTFGEAVMRAFDFLEDIDQPKRVAG